METNNNNKVTVQGSAILKPDLTLAVSGSFENLKFQDILINSPVSGDFQGDLNWSLTSLSKKTQQAFAQSSMEQ